MLSIIGVTEGNGETTGVPVSGGQERRAGGDHDRDHPMSKVIQ